MRLRLLVPLAIALAGAVVATSAGGSAGPERAGAHASPTATARASAGDPVIATAGDIACDPGHPSYNAGEGVPNTPSGDGQCRQKYTAELLAGADAVLPLGDNQYEVGATSAYTTSYGPTWGVYNSIAHPVPGNHEYQGMAHPHAADYYAYFGAAAGDPAKGYYSWDLGEWHLIALNSECSEIGGCDAGSPEELWLRADLRANSKPCILAYQHRARFSSGDHGNNGGSPWSYDAIWRALYEAGADIFLSGHDHDYERFAPQNPDGQVDTHGIRQFVVGTGGSNLVFFKDIKPNTEIRDRKSFGVLKLTLHPTSYDWQFVPEATSTFTDSGSTSCQALTAAGFRELTAHEARKGIRIHWRTASEARIAAFSVYRERNGRRVRLNSRLIPAGGRPAGRAYTWLDAAAPKGTLRYWVSTIDVDGQERSFGPATVLRR